MQNKLRLFCRMLVFVGMLMIETGCAPSADDYDLIVQFSVPEGAHDVKKLKLGTENTQQLYFWIREEYPSAAVLERYRNYLRNDDWNKCRNAKEGWSSYEDLSGGIHYIVHQMTEHWINGSDGKLLILSARYYSKDRSKNRPDNDEQQIIVWVQQTDDLKSELERLELNCNSL